MALCAPMTCITVEVTCSDIALNVSCMHFFGATCRCCLSQAFCSMGKVSIAFQEWDATVCMMSCYIDDVTYSYALESILQQGWHTHDVQGLGRHSVHDVSVLAQNLQSISTILGDKPYLLGDAPCEADIMLFALLDGIIHSALMAPAYKEMVKKFPNLTQYAQRI